MHTYTMSTVADRAYRTADVLTITPRDEGAAVWRVNESRSKRVFLGTIINGCLCCPLGYAALRKAPQGAYYYLDLPGKASTSPVTRKVAYAMAREAGHKILAVVF